MHHIKISALKTPSHLSIKRITSTATHKFFVKNKIVSRSHSHSKPALNLDNCLYLEKMQIDIISHLLI
jgi:hypothetical protein